MVTVVMTTVMMTTVAEIAAGAEAASTSRPSGSALGLAIVRTGPVPTPYTCRVRWGTTTPCTASARIRNPTMVARFSSLDLDPAFYHFAHSSTPSGPSLRYAATASSYTDTSIMLMIATPPAAVRTLSATSGVVNHQPKPADALSAAWARISWRLGPACGGSWRRGITGHSSIAAWSEPPGERHPTSVRVTDRSSRMRSTRADGWPHRKRLRARPAAILPDFAKRRPLTHRVPSNE